MIDSLRIAVLESRHEPHATTMADLYRRLCFRRTNVRESSCSNVPEELSVSPNGPAAQNVLTKKANRLNEQTVTWQV
jgi:hypothetical protein